MTKSRFQMGLDIAPQLRYTVGIFGTRRRMENLMAVYNAPLLKIDPGETRRYAGLMKAKDFDESLIEEACESALLLAAPKGIWQVYDYDCESQEIKAPPPCKILGKKIGEHLAGCDKVVLLSATVGEEIEETVTKKFQEGEYAFSLLLDAAATTAVEQLADAMEKAIQPKASAKGYNMRWRFSPGYGDWPLEQQPDILRLSHGEEIGMSLSESLMLLPRKSITAIIGLYKRNASMESPASHIAAKSCENCDKKDCPSRRER